MTIENVTVVDAIGLDRTGREVVLSISDHLDWTDPQEHQQLLQDKINAYLAFIESGEMLETYPGAKGRVPVIQVVGAHPLDAAAIEFFERALPVVHEIGVELRFTMLPEAQQ